MNPSIIRFLEVVGLAILLAGLKAVSDNILGSGLVSTGTATIITAVIALVEQVISGPGTAFFGAIRRA